MNNLLNLEKAYNIRTIDGYKANGDIIINSKLFLRGDCLSELSENDVNYLLEYGLGTVIDLRSADELISKPDVFEKDSRVKYYNVPLIANQENGGNNAQDLTKLMMKNAREVFPKFYIEMLDKSKDGIKQIFEIIEENLDKTILFHCTAGKDRTGIIAMLLLGLVSVSDEDIIANYVVTYENNCKNPSFSESRKSLPLEIFLSDKEYIVPSIEYIKINYGSYFDYLLSTGLSTKTLENISRKFLKDFDGK